MQFVNPFDRKNKKDEIPYSVFPASKITRTSMQIGRAVPVYTIEAIKNNTWKCSISQLTRFMTMEKPVMNDFQVNFGAFFVPYVALDDVTGHRSYAKLSQVAAQRVTQYGLCARDFFNPSLADSNRILPIMRSISYVGNIKLVGSLWDHLNYPIYDNVDIVDLGLWLDKYSHGDVAYNQISQISSMTQLLLADNLPFIITHDEALNTYTLTEYHDSVVDTSVDGSVGMMPFAIWCLLNRDFKFNAWSIPGTTTFNDLQFGGYANWIWTAHSFALAIDWSNATTDEQAYMYRDWQALVTLLQDPNSTLYDWSTYFKTYTYEQVCDMYINYVQNQYIVTSALVSKAFTANLLPFLAYLRIYGDYFLNELVTDKEQFFATIASVYTQSGVSTSYNITQCYGLNKTLAIFNDNVNFFWSYLLKGQCLPVLWEKDFFTSAQIKETSGSDVTIANGDTIPTLFYKRMYQRFKDLIARMGSDYKTNVDALYGGKIPDSTLQRSQVIGFKKFNVSVGAIAQTSESSAAGTLADFGGYAYSNDKTDSFEWTAEENGIIMILCWVRPLFTSISSATPRFLIKQNYLDFLLPQFGGVGYQDIPNKLLNATVSSAYQNTKYGIQERYFEYMTLLNESSGNFRDIARQYAVDRVVDSTTQLSETGSPAFLYITEDDDINRIFMDTTSDPILCSIYFDGTITRQLPATIRTDF